MEAETRDRIDRSVGIDASAERVFTLVSEPGWWINDGALVAHRIENDGPLRTVHDPVHGAFRFRIETIEEPRRVVFRCFGEQGASTLVEFDIADRPEGGVTLRVVESGFADLPGTGDDRRRQYEDNVSGWRTELALVVAACK